MTHFTCHWEPFALVEGHRPFVPVWGQTLGSVGLLLLGTHGPIANLAVSQFHAGEGLGADRGGKGNTTQPLLRPSPAAPALP